jgi:hypothetical protein
MRWTSPTFEDNCSNDSEVSPIVQSALDKFLQEAFSGPF